ncbi:nuclear transport factor 2 family protein [Nocardia miyunensis]|uniref:nuclear transport factor 2 family protein n=1 Tax=Nocardia miyunensis TaxID=282684 RepID=UPI00082A6590|nr:nuclear transport factor 2 family protein [Nocardia miyunensis]
MSHDRSLADRIEALEARLAVLEDEKAIRELLARYGYYADAQLDDEYFGLFTEDCVMDVSTDREPDPYAIVRWEGLAEMKNFLSVRSAAHGDGFVGRSLHMQGNNQSITVRGDAAVANNYSFILHQDGLDIRLVSASINEWHLRRVDGRWQVAERKRRMVGAPDTARILRASE